MDVERGSNDAERKLEKAESKLQGLEKWANKKRTTGELRLRRKQQSFKEGKCTRQERQQQ